MKQTSLHLSKIRYPFLPTGKKFYYVSPNNRFMISAKAYALQNSLDDYQKNASVVVIGDEVVGYGANGSNFHKIKQCVRKLQGIPTGQGYELCEGCHPKNHSEPKAIQQAKNGGHNLNNGSIYLWGHWWCCEPCWQTIISCGIGKVYLMRRSEVLFNPDKIGNILKGAVSV